MPSSPPFITVQNLNQIQKHIPKAWNKPHQTPSSSSSSSYFDSVHSLIATIKSLSINGHLSKAFTSFSTLLQLHSPASHLLHHPISSLLSCSTKLKAFPQGLQLHALTISLGLPDNPFLVSRLTSFYATLGLLNDVFLVVKSSNTLHAMPWNILLSSCLRMGFLREAAIAYVDMVRAGVKVDEYSYPCVLSACGEALDLEFGRMVHKNVVCGGVELDLFVRTTLVAMYVKCGQVGDARRVFDGMPERDVALWNSMIEGYVSAGMWEEAFDLLERMRMGGVEVDTVTWNTILGGNLNAGKYIELLELIQQMTRFGSAIDFVSLVIGLNACSMTQSRRLGKEIHGALIRMGCHGLENVRNALITMYSRCDNIVYACILFQMAANERSVVCFNAMIAGFAHADLAKEASLVFRQLIASALQPNYVTLVSMLSLFARVADLQHGRELHCYILKHRFETYQFCCNSLLDMYSKSGRMSEATKLFAMMDKHDVVSFTSLIAGYGMQGDGFTALKLFNKMIECGIDPDHITMVAILSSCSKSGLVTEGQMLFSKMVTLYGIVPRMEHYSCMVDLFGRVGLLRNAEEIILRMPFKPNTAMLATLICACRAHGNVEIGKRTADKLLEMRPNNPSHYVLIANMYAYANDMQELEKARTLMRIMGIDGFG